MDIMILYDKQLSLYSKSIRLFSWMICWTILRNVTLFRASLLDEYLFPVMWELCSSGVNHPVVSSFGRAYSDKTEEPSLQKQKTI